MALKPVANPLFGSVGTTCPGAVVAPGEVTVCAFAPPAAIKTTAAAAGIIIRIRI
jgi:hypothetical protein